MKREGENMRPSVLITGAYGGMGKATAQALACQGYRVFAMDQTVGAEEKHIIPVRADLTEPTSVAAAFDKICAQTDELSAVIHFAGIYMLDSLVEMEEKDFERIFRINLGGVFLVNKIFLPLLKKGSHIVITTSELAPLDPLPFTGIYAVTKSALDRYAFSLRMELQLQGIKVSVLRAGAVKTGMLGVSTAALHRFCQKTELYSCNAERFREIVDRVEARGIEPSAIAKKVLRILKKRKPKFAFSLNRNPLLLLLNLLPQRLQLWAIRQVLK
ncbi:MAG: SDR family NAD(P)-dependent oxidoreductase [Oscillospiraceae bacterium]|nr:SDR family NAD(P)-dependent oxidoreductase [Oscillospiraceae bacterium]